MPIYCYSCNNCGERRELLREIPQRGKVVYCSSCGSPMRRALGQEGAVVRGDIEPRYDFSLGEYVGSRREYREKLAQHNAYSPDLFLNTAPSAGRLTKEERQELEVARAPASDGDAGWLDGDGITVEGEADYGSIRAAARRRHAKRTGRRMPSGNTGS